MNKEKIKLFGNVYDFLLTRKCATDEQWDAYFQKYSDGVDYVVDNEAFITYQENEDHIFIKDFFALGEGLSLVTNLLKKKKPLRALVHMANIEMLNASRKFKFNILSIVGNQYLIERK